MRNSGSSSEDSASNTAVKLPSYTRGEEIANSVIHGLGVGLSVAALAVLVTFAGLWGDVWRVVSFAVYGSSLILLYLASTLYHAFRNQRLKELFRIFDHAAIFLLIAGTYTPFTLVTLRGPWGWTLFGLVWACALAGVVTTVAFLKAPRWLPPALYIGMGWLVVIALKPLFAALSIPAIALMAAGGISYTGGVAFYLWDRLPFNHAIWHGFVLGGSVTHFLCILLYVLPMEGA